MNNYTYRNPPPYVQQWPRAYKWSPRIPGQDREGRWVPVWPEDAPEPTEEMIEAGAVWLGKGVAEISLMGWAALSGHWFPVPWMGDGGRLSYALDPHDPRAAEIIREFRSDLVGPDYVRIDKQADAEWQRIFQALAGHEDYNPGYAPWTFIEGYKAGLQAGSHQPEDHDEVWYDVVSRLGTLEHSRRCIETYEQAKEHALALAEKSPRSDVGIYQCCNIIDRKKIAAVTLVPVVGPIEGES